VRGQGSIAGGGSVAAEFALEKPLDLQLAVFIFKSSHGRWTSHDPALKNVNNHRRVTYAVR